MAFGRLLHRHDLDDGGRADAVQGDDLLALGAVPRRLRVSDGGRQDLVRCVRVASRGRSPRVTRVCRAGFSEEQDHVRESVVSTGTATESTGMEGRYLATRRAVLPPRVRTTIIAA